MSATTRTDHTPRAWLGSLAAYADRARVAAEAVAETFRGVVAGFQQAAAAAGAAEETKR